MKLCELKSILYSTHGNISFAILYEEAQNRDVENGCSVEYAIKNYGDKVVKHIEAFEDQLLITI